MEDNKMTNNQFKGIIKMIIALIRNDTPKEELIEYLTELLRNKKLNKGQHKGRTS